MMMPLVVNGAEELSVKGDLDSATEEEASFTSQEQRGIAEDGNGSDRLVTLSLCPAPSSHIQIIIILFLFVIDL